MTTLGISAFYHDSAAALIDSNGEIVAAAQEERFTRVKHDFEWPTNAIEYCLKTAKISPSEITKIVFYELPLLKFERIIKGYSLLGKSGYKEFNLSFPNWYTSKLDQADKIVSKLSSLDSNIDWRKKLFFIEHHLSHAASAYYPSPFDEAVVLTIDGVGEFATTTVSIAKDNTLEKVKQMEYPQSLGLLYSAFTYYLGFKVNSGEYKLMGLAPYGEPKYTNIILDNIIDIAEDGSYHINTSYFDHFAGEKIINNSFEKLFSLPKRNEGEQLTQKHMDIAASIQNVLESLLVTMTKSLREEFGIPNLCLAGGVALNCVANSKIRNESGFKSIWIQPAAGDAGGALGAALYGHNFNKGKRKKEASKEIMQGAYLGPSFSENEVKNSLTSLRASFEILEDNKLFEKTAEALASGKTVAWFQGRMEYGPRALGSRSILADPRSEKMQKQLNLKVKKRESFRPFAPAVMEEHVGKWFKTNNKSPYMLFVDSINSKKLHEDTKPKVNGFERLSYIPSDIPAVTHVNLSARVQTVTSNSNPTFHKLLESFYNKTDCPILVNTSFNVRGEPIVCSPTDAYKTFLNTDLDILVIENFWIEQEKQSSLNKLAYEQHFPSD